MPDRRPDRAGGRACVLYSGLAGRRDPVVARCHHATASASHQDMTTPLRTSMKMLSKPPWWSAPAVAALRSIAALPSSAQEASHGAAFSPGFKFVQTTGEQLFAN